MIRFILLAQGQGHKVSPRTIWSNDCRQGWPFCTKFTIRSASPVSKRLHVRKLVHNHVSYKNNQRLVLSYKYNTSLLTTLESLHHLLSPFLTFLSMKNSARSNSVFQCQVGNLCSTFRLLGFFVYTKLTWRTLCKQTGHEYAKQSPDTATTNTYACTSSIHFKWSPICFANLSSVCWPCAGTFTTMLQMHVLEDRKWHDMNM